MMIRLKWPANKPNESYMTGECDAPPPLLDTTEVWMGNYWFSKILILIKLKDLSLRDLINTA